ncbi:hypothetical protein ACFQH9_06575 [Pseudonocardia lutea]|uniref:Uncharacterized protein n=1 Tax=Pseudonocardia lutea TaxID=2172015 RepID=A0ABW1I3E3_9PSEU
MKVLRALLTSAVFATAGLLAVAGSAQAAPPQAVVVEDRILPQGDYCTNFAVHVVVYSASSDEHHPGFATGPGYAVVTNTTSNKSIRYNVSGPGTFTVNPDGGFSVSARGTNLFWTTKANSYPGVPQISYTSGPVSFTVAGSGKTTAYSHSGATTDVCAALS